ncbi:MAG: transporter substrate-binding domain-containing protein [Anaerolineales bacterium]|nr:transporter substrate-binding domain-containing protein [Anaerolineales bacterium]
MNTKTLFGLLLLLFLLAGCRDEGVEAVETAVTPTPTRSASPTTQSTSAIGDPNFIVIATDAPDEPFTSFNKFGEVSGFLPDLMAGLAAQADLGYEFVVTPYEGALNSIGKDFDAVMSTFVLTDSVPPEGVVYTDPYLQVGQVLIVLADVQDLQSYTDLQPGMTVGVQAFSSGYEAARTVMGLSTNDIFTYDSPRGAIEALVDESIHAVILDHYSAEHFVATYPEQLKIVGGFGTEAWISSKAYSIAVSANDTDLLNRLNEAIAAGQRDGSIVADVTTWLVPDVADIDAGESRVGTPDTELIIGIVGTLEELDPATVPDLINWEVMQNTMSGLYRFNAANELQPALAADFPTISADKLEYTIRLRPGLRFPDGSEFTADDVKWSLDRASVVGSGSYLVNRYLKDADEDGFADADAVQVVDPITVKIVLQEPLGYFPSILATPPFFPISNECYAEVLDPLSECGGLGPYTITSWEPGERMRLQANPEWPGDAPQFPNIQLRFYDTPTLMMRSLTDFQSIDVAWTGLAYADFVTLQNQDADGNGRPDFIGWEGPATFKSYLIFEQTTAPWDNKKVRQAASFAIDREALANEVFGGSRLPLYSPVPDDVPGHVTTEPQRDLAQARALLLEVGYSQTQPLPITIWYLNDGRYTNLETAYATAIKNQLEETGVFQVTLSPAPWEILQTQIFSCGYPAYLIGWPSPGAPVEYLDVPSWTNFFVQNTDRVFCSNYQSAEMDRLVAAAQEEIDPTARQAIYAEIQTLWANELPTLDLTQEPRRLLSLPKIGGVQIDALGMLHYDLLTKTGD